jgi:hypothetical protein
MAINRVSVTDDDGSGTTGTVGNAAFITALYDSIEDKPRCRAYKTTSNQSVNNTTLTEITLNAESFDSGTLHDNVTANTKITVPTGGGGVYLIGGSVRYAVNGTGLRAAQVRKNGATILSTTEHGGADASIQTFVMTTTIVVLAAADYIELMAYQSSGGALDVEPDESGTALWLIKLW